MTRSEQDSNGEERKEGKERRGGWREGEREEEQKEERKSFIHKAIGWRQKAVTGRQAHPNRDQKRQPRAHTHGLGPTAFLPEAPDLVSASRLSGGMSPAWPALGFLKSSHRLQRKGWIKTVEHPLRTGVGGDGAGDRAVGVKE